MIRAIARALARYAATGLPRSRPAVEGLILRELDQIPGDAEALVWALGCAWEIRVEWRLARRQPFANCALLMMGLYVTVNFLVPHLAWYGVKRYLPGGLDATARGLVRLAIYLVLVLFLTLALTGQRTRRLFGAVMFPFLALWGFAAYALGAHAVNLLRTSVGGPLVDIALGGPLFGLTTALPPGVARGAALSRVGDADCCVGIDTGHRTRDVDRPRAVWRSLPICGFRATNLVARLFPHLCWNFCATPAALASEHSRTLHRSHRQVTGTGHVAQDSEREAPPPENLMLH